METTATNGDSKMVTTKHEGEIVTYKGRAFILQRIVSDDVAILSYFGGSGAFRVSVSDVQPRR
jgi:hypothetical protein